MDELYHHGVKGMKWGVRRSRSAKYKGKTKGWSKEAKEAYRIKQKKVKQMSNKELQTLNKRTQLEQEYKRLNPNAVKRGVAAVGTASAALGTVAGLYVSGKKLGKNIGNLIKDGKAVVERGKNLIVELAIADALRR